VVGNAKLGVDPLVLTVLKYQSPPHHVVLCCGCVVLWLITGNLEHVVSEHTAPVFTLRWNKRGDLLITGSADKGTKVLDANTWRVKQTFTPHTSEPYRLHWLS
jgi:transducin (beta)-like 1